MTTQGTKAVTTTSKAVVKKEKPQLPDKFSYLADLVTKKEEVEWIYRSIMTEGVDYGTIPGTPKPTLYKSGAEMLRGFFKHVIEFHEDDTGTDLLKGIFFWTVRCKVGIRNPETGEVEYIGEGLGHCNSLESKYRYRWVTRDQLPVEFAKADKPWEAWANKHGPATVKSKYGKGGKTFNVFRIENDIPHDLANTILKMAKKRAFVDAELTVTGASRIFLVEDDLQGSQVPEKGDQVEPLTGEIIPGEIVDEDTEEKQAPQESQVDAAFEAFDKNLQGFVKQLAWKEPTLNSYIKTHFPGCEKPEDLSPKQRDPLLHQLADMVAMK